MDADNAIADITPVDDPETKEAAPIDEVVVD